ncbi:MAG: HAD-IC family P-type ATPase, partial [Sphingobacteriales bacterium]
MNGLTTAEVEEKRKQFGANTIEFKEDRVFLSVLKEIVLEPMFLLLLAACIIYFLTGQQQEGIIMLVSIFLVAGISIFQEYRSRNAIAALKKLSQAHVNVLRNHKEEKINIEDVVMDDIILMEEGELIAADAALTESRDFTVNESILTGEAFAVTKQIGDQLYRGTLVTSGRAMARVNAIGKNTAFGKVADAVQEVQTQKTPLQLQIKSFVKNMVLVGAMAFVLVVVLNYVQTHELITSIMQGLTLAMSILPEEIPVAFSTFQALGAFRLLRQNIIVKQPQYVETLGAASVICADKTGTLTENKMSIEWLYDSSSNQIISTNEEKLPIELIE